MVFDEPGSLWLASQNWERFSQLPSSRNIISQSGVKMVLEIVFGALQAAQIGFVYFQSFVRHINSLKNTYPRPVLLLQSLPNIFSTLSPYPSLAVADLSTHLSLELVVR